MTQSNKEPEVARLLKNALERMRPAGLVSAYLFGSLAEGRAHRESDVDIGILLDRTELPEASGRFELRIRLGSRLAAELGRNDVDIVALNDAPPGLAARIVTRGRRLVCFDGEADHAFRRDVQLMAADLELFLSRMRRIKLQALRGKNDVSRRANR